MFASVFKRVTIGSAVCTARFMNLTIVTNEQKNIPVKRTPAWYCMRDSHQKKIKCVLPKLEDIDKFIQEKSASQEPLDKIITECLEDTSVHPSITADFVDDNHISAKMIAKCKDYELSIIFDPVSIDELTAARK